MSNTEFDISKFHIPTWQELPNIDLYMDQVLTYIEEYLSPYIKTDSEEKIITKTMVNNYVKQEILESPINKKYNKLNIAKLFVICILKQVYSIGEIKTLIAYALEKSTPENGYDNFCFTFEEILKSTFKKTSLSTKKDLTEEQYLLKNVVQSVANKLFVQTILATKNAD